MNKSIKNFWGYVLRFAVLHVLIYTVIATIFLLIQDMLLEPTRIALETFTPYHSIGLIAILGQILRAAVLALVLYPFYDTIVRGRNSMLILFGALWGVALLGSVEPMPGSIEGVIYTEIPLAAHLIILFVSALETVLFLWIFIRWERGGTKGEDFPDSAEIDNQNKTLGYFIRFTLVHVLTYAVAGILLFVLQSYEEAFAVPGRFELYRPLDDPIVAAAIPLQIVRGGILAFFISPFYNTFMRKANGWLLLFGLIFGLIALGGPNFLTGVLTDIVTRTPLSEFLIGPVEIAFQMLLFTLIFYGWERVLIRRRRTS